MHEAEKDDEMNIPSFSLGEEVYDCWEVNAIVAHDRGLIPRPNKEIAHIHATRVRTTPTKTPF